MKFVLKRRPRSPKVQHEIVRAEVRAAYKKFCEDAVKRLKKDIASWEHQPTFRYKYAAGEKLWYVNVSYDSDSEAGQIYNWVDEGTGENAGKGGKYPIVPRNAKSLQFLLPNRPKSTPGVSGIPGIVVSSGTMQRELIYAKKVMHPGIRPRNFVKSLRDDLNQREKVGGFRSVTEAAIKRGTRKLGKNAK